MANINDFLLKIKEAIYGEEVRGSIHDALDAMNKECINSEAVAISSRDSARHQANKSEEHANRSEAWAVGSIYGQDVPPEDPQYKNNAKYWGKYAQKYAEGGVRWKGSVTFAEIPRTDNIRGDMYNVSTEFYTDERFDEIPGTFCPARTNIIFNENGLWDISTGNIAGYSDAEYETYDEAYQHIDELQSGQTVYIRQKKQDAYNANLAPVEAHQESSRQYEKDEDILVFNRVLYQVINNINEGDTLVEHENIEKTTIAQLLKLFSKKATPIGTITPFAGATAPEGYLICDGSAISREDYADLFDVIGTTWGSGDDSTTFNIPDLREVAPVGIGTSTRTEDNHDTFTLGEFKDDQMQSHTHTYSAPNGTGKADYNDYKIYPYTSVTSANSGAPSGRTGDVTRGKRIGVNYIIKY